MPLKDLTGKSFGRLKVVGRADDYIQPSGRHRTMWLCECECGNTTSVSPDFLKSNKTVSCGCYKKEFMSKKMSTHGESKDRLYLIWCSMKRRCYNKNSTYYNRYGGRGISMCNEWSNSYICFKEWAINNGYDKDAPRGKCTIDRIDNNGNYSPDNCRIVDSVVQANNRSSNKIYAYNGDSHNIKELSTIYNIPYKTLYNRLYSGWDIDKAITT